MGDVATVMCALPVFGVCHGIGQCCSLLLRVIAPLRSYSLNIVTHHFSHSLPPSPPNTTNHHCHISVRGFGYHLLSSHPQDMICVSDPNQNKLAV